MIRPLLILALIFGAIIAAKMLYKVTRHVGLQWVLTLLVVFAALGAMVMHRTSSPRSPSLPWGLGEEAPMPSVGEPSPPALGRIPAPDQGPITYEITYDDGSTAVVTSGEPYIEKVTAHAGVKKSVVTRFQQTVSRYGQGATRGGIVWTLLKGVAIAAFLYLSYLFLDAGTRGHFTWQLRVISVLAFVGICVAIAALRGGL